jgi:hypothetical protein
VESFEFAGKGVMKLALEISGYTLAGLLMLFGLLDVFGWLPQFLAVPPLVSSFSFGAGFSFATVNILKKFRLIR